MNRTGLEAVVKRRWLVAILTLTVASGLPLRTHAEPRARYQPADLEALQQAFIELAATVRPSVVAIRTYDVRDPQSPGAKFVMRPHSQGSGFIMHRDGYVATNRHVIADADVISIVLNNGMKFEGTVVQADKRSDLAVLKIDAEGLKAVTFGDLSEVRVNQWVFACGNPFGLANDNGGASVTYGAVSALGRQMTQRLVGESDVEYYGNMIETSATINPGNSGGPLFNIDGEVIGIVAAIETTSGVSEGHGFAIPIDRNTRRILDTLHAGREVRYGFLGVLVQDVEAPRSSLVVNSRVHRGVELRSISFSDGPAAQAGLKARDVVIEYDGTPIENADHFVRLVGFTPVGTEVPVVFLRNGVKRRTVVAVGDRSEMLTRAERTD